MEKYYDKVLKQVQEKNIEGLIGIDLNKLDEEEIDALFHNALDLALVKYIELINYGSILNIKTDEEIEKIKSVKISISDILSTKEREKLFYEFYNKILKILKDSKKMQFTGIKV